MYKLPNLTKIQRDLLGEFFGLSDNITNISDKYKELAKKHWDSIAKPFDSLGEFEKIFQKFSAIFESEIPDIDKKCIVVMCADNGIVEEGISQSEKNVTLAVAKSMAKGTSSIAVLTRAQNSKLLISDIGIDTFDTDIYSLGVLNHKLMHGTNNFLKEKAMAFDITLRAILIGIKTVFNLKQDKIGIIGTGEMGIGNTTTSSALSSVLLDIPAVKATGRGAGLNDDGLLRKIKVIEEGISKYCFKEKYFYNLLESDNKEDKTVAILDLLSSLGGLDIAGLVGIFLGGAIYKIPVVIDGIISEVAALLAYYLNPLAKEYMVASHLSKEPAAKMIFDVLELKPVIYASLALGEGSGCALLFSLLDIIIEIYIQNTSFSDINIRNYKRFL